MMPKMHSPRRATRTFCALAILVFALVNIESAKAESLIVQSTTSAQNSGLYDALLPLFEAQTGIRVRVVAVGTGQALRNAADGNGDLLITHHPPSEMAFIARGYGTTRHPFMKNHYLLLGPASDPAEIRTATNLREALVRIARHGAQSRAQNQQAQNQQIRFISRGDDSGTHKRELELWQASGVKPLPHQDPQNRTWYLEAGAGMGTTLNLAAEQQAYTLTDQASWLSFKHPHKQRGGLEVLFARDSLLGNQYAAVLVSPQKHPHTQHAAAKTLVAWLVSPQGQKAIAGYKINGAPLFTPNAQEFAENAPLLEGLE